MIFIRNIFFVGVLFVLPVISFAQDTSAFFNDSMRLDLLRTQYIEEISIKRTKGKRQAIRPVGTWIFEDKIQKLSPDDIGELASKLSGSTVRSYGGLGALKSISTRALGSQHTAIVVDGFNVSNSQTGMTNLGQIQADGMVSILSSTNDNVSIFLPVSAYLSGNSLVMNTFQSRYGDARNQLRSSFKLGSFGRYEGYLSGVYSKDERIIFSGYAKYRSARGDYDYSYLNGLTTEEGVRNNNDYEDGFFGGQVKILGKKNGSYRFGYRGSMIDQGLPGAVILYNSTADERLNTLDNLFYADAKFNFKRWEFRSYANYNWNAMKYLDPTYLNEIGFLDNEYINQSTNLGTVFRRRSAKGINVIGGLEETLSTLVSSDSSLSNPFRSHSSGFVSVYKPFKSATIKVQLSSQYIYELASLNNSPRESIKVNPSVDLTFFKEGSWHFKHLVWYKNTFRIPSFNELYYATVGNSELLPESAHQINYGVSSSPKNDKRANLDLRTTVYFNRVQNKIVAIPTKNLFIWSMQNVTNVNIFGMEGAIDFCWGVGKIDVDLNVNYSYQKAIDVTKESLNYGHQIAYTPEHLANFDLLFSRGELGFGIANNYVSMRFALNENIDQNRVQDYLLSDLFITYSFVLKKGQKIKLQANVKNIFDSSYVYVRSFVMPGRNFLISMSYALH